MTKTWTLIFASIAILLLVSAKPAFAQTPQPPGSQVPDLKPVAKLTSVSLNGGAQKPLTSLTLSVPPRLAVPLTVSLLNFPAVGPPSCSASATRTRERTRFMDVRR